MNTILGIDPGLGKTGWGVVKNIKGKTKHIAHGIIKPKMKGTLSGRLSHLSINVAYLLKIYEPNIVIVEDAFFGVNPSSTLRLGMACGAILASVGEANIDLLQYSSRLVKQKVTGNGGSSKEEVQEFVLQQLKLEKIEVIDSSDALAIALSGIS